MNRLFALTAVCGLLQACVSTGVEIQQADLDSFIVGFSTQDDVVAQMGSPTSEIKLSSGATILLYAYASSQTHPESFLPIIGPLFAGGKIRSSTALFEFDGNGVLRSLRRATSSGASGLTVLPP
ncbi:hypothetical protein [Cupriavidus pauculus]|uniref:hypothetical protein n=1 Tax=Cupriavidus pauculus TaxID=82633 RepID=UPI001EE2DD22|nr:hypothetical protein [Cupriavidus pauculus]GJG98549.1 hypothetical protein CBA19C6_28690 [Cupriavidus pauculus]